MTCSSLEIIDTWVPRLQLCLGKDAKVHFNLQAGCSIQPSINETHGLLIQTIHVMGHAIKYGTEIFGIGRF